MKQSKSDPRRAGCDGLDLPGLFDSETAEPGEEVDLLGGPVRPPLGETCAPAAGPPPVLAKALRPPPVPAPPPALAAPSAPEAPTVSELAGRIRSLLESGIGEVWVRGEISNLREQPSGHKYFTLKDERAQLSCALFAGQPGSRVKIADGDKVRLFGRVTVYEPRGQMQISVKRIELAGAGELLAKLEELKRRLAAEGLFAEERKRPLPKAPRAIGVVTSSAGAALRDILRVFERRAPYVRVFIRPVRVQGEGAAAEIAAAIRDFSDRARSGFPEVDLIIAGRGGGSIEDLWAFNEEVVARAIFECRIPVISAVGHETDVTIADFVADLRAATPTAAAELAAPDRAELLDRLAQIRTAIRRETTRTLTNAEAKLGAVRSGAAMREPERRLTVAAQTLDGLAELARVHTSRRFAAAADRLAALAQAVERHRPGEVLSRHARRLAELVSTLPQLARRTLKDKATALQALTARLRLAGPAEVLRRHEKSLSELAAAAARNASLCLEAKAQTLASLAERARLLGPANTLARGYSITRIAGREEIVRDAAQAPPGTLIETLLAGGRILSATVPQPPESAPAGAPQTP